MKNKFPFNIVWVTETMTIQEIFDSESKLWYLLDTSLDDFRKTNRIPVIAFNSDRGWIGISYNDVFAQVASPFFGRGMDTCFMIYKTGKPLTNIFLIDEMLKIDAKVFARDVKSIIMS